MDDLTDEEKIGQMICPKCDHPLTWVPTGMEEQRTMRELCCLNCGWDEDEDEDDENEVERNRF